ncbi:Hypothetical predicted protein, partial [Paramuricea clavata]
MAIDEIKTPFSLDDSGIFLEVASSEIDSNDVFSTVKGGNKRCRTEDGILKNEGTKSKKIKFSEETTTSGYKTSIACVKRGDQRKRKIKWLSVKTENGKKIQ